VYVYFFNVMLFLLLHIFTTAACKQFQHNSINIRHDATPLFYAHVQRQLHSSRSHSFTFRHCIATAIANLSRSKCTRMKLATKKSCRLVERINSMPGHLKIWCEGGVEEEDGKQTVLMNIIIILCAYAMSAAW